MIEPGSKIRVVIADDHAVLRESLAALLNTQPDFVVEGTAANGQQALELVQQRHPDVLVLDLFMPDFDGFDVLRTLDRAGTRVATVVLTGSESEMDYVQVVRLGGRGLVIKSDEPEKLFTAVRAVAQGELAFSDELAKQVVNSMATEWRQEPPKANSLARLSERERQIAYAVARGLKNRDIAEQLSISENTVKRHLQSIFGKTGANLGHFAAFFKRSYRENDYLWGARWSIFTNDVPDCGTHVPSWQINYGREFSGRRPQQTSSPWPAGACDRYRLDSRSNDESESGSVPRPRSAVGYVCGDGHSQEHDPQRTGPAEHPCPRRTSQEYRERELCAHSLRAKGNSEEAQYVSQCLPATFPSAGGTYESSHRCSYGFAYRAFVIVWVQGVPA